MIKNYFKIAWRNLFKNGLYSFVNLIGLSAGILFALLLFAYGWGEWQVNRNLKNADRQYFLSSRWKEPTMGMDLTTVAPIAKRLKEDYPHLVANYYRWDGITSVVSKGDKHFREGIQLGDSTLLGMYGFELLYGNAAHALKEPYSMVITKEKAVKYFGKIDVVGEYLTIQSFDGMERNFMVTGVLKSIPENSVTHLLGTDNNTVFIPTNTYTFFNRTSFDSWDNTIIPSYIELREGVNPAALDAPIKQLIAQNASNIIKDNLTIAPIPLKEYYLQKNNGLVKRMLTTLSLIGLFILLMAVVNFINIAISSAGSRSREIGVRKLIGGQRQQLIFQFLTESLSLVAISTVLAVSVYPFVRPQFSDLIGKEIPQIAAFPIYFTLLLSVFAIIVGVLSGLYPAFVLSSQKTIDALKGKLNTTKTGIQLRKTLVSFQFVIALLVLMGSVVISQQVNHFFSQGLGYEKDFVLTAQVPRDWTAKGVRKMETIRKEFETMPQIKSASLSFEIPNGNSGAQPMVYNVGADSSQAIVMDAMTTDENFLKTYQISMKSGDFFKGNGLDSSYIALNEKAVIALGFKNIGEAVGRKVRIVNDPTAAILTVKGITQDFHFNSMQKAIRPMIFFNVHTFAYYRYLSFKIQPNNIPQNIEAINKKWASLMPQSSFEYVFMDETLKKLYSSEIQLKKTAYAATLLAIIISLLGVIGLISLSIHKRTKEIGVRKILGANPFSIISLFLKEFVIVFLISCLIACPLVYVIMENWLNGFASRIHISPLLMLQSVIGLLLITILLIGLQTIKAAVANPVKSLRTE
jgi:putative ABC transport system permease protein